MTIIVNKRIALIGQLIEVLIFFKFRVFQRRYDDSFSISLNFYIFRRTYGKGQ